MKTIKEYLKQWLDFLSIKCSKVSDHHCSLAIEWDPKLQYITSDDFRYKATCIHIKFKYIYYIVNIILPIKIVKNDIIYNEVPIEYGCA